MNAAVEFEGLDAFKARAASVMPRLIDELEREIHRFASEVISESQRVVPVDTGNLKNSKYVEFPATVDGLTSIRFGYGGAAAGYALYVHEALEGPHPIDPNWSWAKAAAKGKQIQWSTPGTGPKYLETPLKAAMPQLRGRLADAVKRAI